MSQKPQSTSAHCTSEHISDRQAVDEWLSGGAMPRNTYEVFCLWQACLGRGSSKYRTHRSPFGGLCISVPGNSTIEFRSHREVVLLKAALESMERPKVTSAVWAMLEAEYVMSTTGRPRRVPRPLVGRRASSRYTEIVRDE